MSASGCGFGCGCAEVEVVGFLALADGIMGLCMRFEARWSCFEVFAQEIGFRVDCICICVSGS